MAYRTRSFVQKASKLAKKSSSVDLPELADTSLRARRTKLNASKSPRSARSSTSSTITCRSSSEFKDWLALHHTTHQEIWLKIAKKSSGKQSITPDEALEIALCHGWIDGTGRSLDAVYHLRRYTPRRPRSVWSIRNKLKVERLISEGRMTEKGMSEVRAAQADGRWERAYAGPKTMVLPVDLRVALLGQDRPDLVEKVEGMSNAERYRILLRIETSITEESRRKKVGQVVQQLKEMFAT